jgi:hypothetical protein
MSVPIPAAQPVIIKARPGNALIGKSLDAPILLRDGDGSHCPLWNNNHETEIVDCESVRMMMLSGACKNYI